MRQIDLQDAYNILGVSEATPLEEVKNAYKKLALQFHPDKNSAPDATERFQEIGAAYSRVTKHLETPDDDEEDYWDDEDGPDLDFFLFLFARMFARGPRRGGVPPFMHSGAFAESRERRRQEELEKERYFTERKQRNLQAQLDARRKEVERLQAQERHEAAWAAEKAREKKEKQEGKTKACQEQKDALLESKRASQRKRSDVFEAARRRDGERVKKGVWEQDVDAAGQECLMGMQDDAVFLELHQEAGSDSKETLLHIFAGLGDLEMVKWLLAHNAEAEERDSFNRSPFHLALQHAHLPVINFFIETFPPELEDSEAIFEPPKIDSDPSRKYSLLRMAIDSISPVVVRIVIKSHLFDQSELEAAWKFITSDGWDGPGQIYGQISDERTDISKDEKLTKAWESIRDILSKEGGFDVPIRSPPPTLHTPVPSPPRPSEYLPQEPRLMDPLESTSQKKKKPKKPKKKPNKADAGHPDKTMSTFVEPISSPTDSNIKCIADIDLFQSTEPRGEGGKIRSNLKSAHKVKDIDGTGTDIQEPELSYPSPISGYPSSPEATTHGKPFHHYSDTYTAATNLAPSHRRSQHRNQNHFLPYSDDGARIRHSHLPAVNVSAIKGVKDLETVPYPSHNSERTTNIPARGGIIQLPFGFRSASATFAPTPSASNPTNGTGGPRTGDHDGPHDGSRRTVFGGVSRKDHDERRDDEANDATHAGSEKPGGWRGRGRWNGRGQARGRGQGQGYGRGRGFVANGQNDGPKGGSSGGEGVPSHADRGCRGRGGRGRGGPAASAAQARRGAIDVPAV